MISRALFLGLLLLGGSARAEEKYTSGEQRAEQVAASLVGKPAPALKLRSVDGKVIDVSSYRGKQAVYLKFWATWCQPCVEQMPHFQHAYDDAGSDLAVIGINAGFNDTPQIIKAFQRQKGLTMPMTIDDGSAAAALNLRVTPMHVVIDRAGIVRFVGHLADARVDSVLAAVKVRATAPATVQAAPQRVSTKYSIGQRVQPQQFTPVDAAPLTLPAAGLPTVMVFVTTWCEGYLAETRPEMGVQCERSRKQLTSLPAELRSKANWVWVVTGLWNDERAVRKYRDSSAIKAPMVLDTSTTLFNTFDVRDVPAVLVLDRDGVLRQRLHGDEKDLQQRLLETLSAPTKISQH